MTKIDFLFILHIKSSRSTKVKRLYIFRLSDINQYRRGRVKCFIEAYKTARDPDHTAVRGRANEVRSIGTSVVFKNNFAVQHVMRAGILKFLTTFTSVYLRDVMHHSLDMFFLGPMVAAQQVT